MLDSDLYDVIVLGTGLAESIAAAALAKAGKSVLHLDPNEYYGGDQASLTLDELVAWADARGAEAAVGADAAEAEAEPQSEPGTSASAPASTSASGSDYMASQRERYSHTSTSGLGTLAADRRRYALSLYPALMVSRGTLIETLVASDVAKYIGFQLLNSVRVWDERDEGSTESGLAALRRVPGTKEDVFKDKSIPLLDKRRLMKALMFAGGEFESDELMQGHETDPILAFLSTTFALPPHLVSAVAFAVAHATSPDEPALPALQRARRYLRSIGRYGPSPFLLAQYGGAGEVAQGFCRACAVFNGTYVLGPDASVSGIKVDEDTKNVRLSIAGHPRELSARHLITAPHFLPPALRPVMAEKRRTARAVVVLTSRPAFVVRESAGEEGEEDQDDSDDTAVLVLSPRVRALVMGEGTGSCPARQYVVYLWTEAAEGATDAEAGAELRKVVAELPDVAFSAYYMDEARAVAQTEEEKETKARDGATEGEEGTTSAPTKPDTDTSSPLILVNPYAGPHLLTEGLDWEAEQGARAFRAAANGAVFFERTVEEGETEELE